MARGGGGGGSGEVRGGSSEAAPAEERYEHLADVADLLDGELRAVMKASGEEICLFSFRGTIGAVGNVCTHAEFPMSDGTLKHGGVIECVWHGAQFDCRSGAVCRGPAVDALPVYEVRLEGGRVLVGPRRR